MDAVKELVFRFPVYRREGVIQNNEGAAVIEKASNHDPGLLTAGKADASFAYHRFDASGKGGGLFVKAGAPDHAKQVWLRFNDALRAEGLDVKEGRFGAHMRVDIANDGPVTIVMDTDELMK